MLPQINYAFYAEMLSFDSINLLRNNFIEQKHENKFGNSRINEAGYLRMLALGFEKSGLACALTMFRVELVTFYNLRPPLWKIEPDSGAVL